MQNLLQSLGLSVDNPNLMPRLHIRKVLTMSPIEMVGMVKEAAGGQSAQAVLPTVKAHFGTTLDALRPDLASQVRIEPQEGRPIDEGLVLLIKTRVAGDLLPLVQARDELSGGIGVAIAIAFVLSLVRLKPSPIMIFDELTDGVDYDVKQGFGEVVQSLSKLGQIIVGACYAGNGILSNGNVVFQTKFRTSMPAYRVSTEVHRAVNPALAARRVERRQWIQWRTELDRMLLLCAADKASVAIGTADHLGVLARLVKDGRAYLVRIILAQIDQRWMEALDRGTLRSACGTPSGTPAAEWNAERTAAAAVDAIVKEFEYSCVTLQR